MVAKRVSEPAGRSFPPSLETNSLPSRRQGKETFELILATAGKLLEEVGFERLSTNMVSAEAGVTPPALYRYFPNKYALLAELARRLMEAQDEALLAWIETGGSASPDLEESVRRHVALRKQLVTITRNFPGGVWILRAIRALPLLQEVRVASRNMVLDRRFEKLRETFPAVDEARLRMAIRLAEQVAYSTIEMIVEDRGLDEDKIIEESAWMTCLYYEARVSENASAASRKRRSA